MQPGAPLNGNRACGALFNPTSTRLQRLRSGGSAIAMAGLLCAILSGCLADRGPKSFLNPAELTSSRHQPLRRPILTSLGTQWEAEDQQFASATDVMPDDLTPSYADYVISRNDVLNVSITELVGPGIETLKQVRVSESGNISLPYINSIKAAGLTEPQLEQEIANEYKRRNIIANAQVSVSVVEARGRVFSILGGVARAGQYQILNADFRVLDALTLAGDLSYPNTEFLYIIRPNPEGATTQPATPMNGTQGNVPQTPRPSVNQPDVFVPPPGISTGGGTATGPSTEPAPPTPGTTPAGPMTEDHPAGAYISEGGHATTWTGSTGTGTTTIPATGPADVGLAAGGTPEVFNPASNQTPFEFHEPPAVVTNSRIIKVPVGLLREGDLRYNAIIRPNDTILIPIPKIARYFVGAHVVRPGVYDMTNQQITLKQAIISAGMLDDLAIPQRTDLIRRVDPNHEVYVRVDLSKVFDGEQPDIYLKPNDTIMVGTNFGAPFLAALRNSFRITYGFGFLYDRNYATYTNSSGIQH